MLPSVKPHGLFWIDTEHYCGLVLAAAATLAQVPCLAVRAYVKVYLDGNHCSHMEEAAFAIETLEADPGNKSVKVEEIPVKDIYNPGVLYPFPALKRVANLSWTLPVSPDVSE